MVGGTGQELCFLPCPTVVMRHNSFLPSGVGQHISWWWRRNLHSLSSLFSLCNSYVKCQENIFANKMRKLNYGSIRPLCAFLCSLLPSYHVSWIWILALSFFTFQVTFNEWFVAFSEYFRISSFKNAFSPGRKEEVILAKASTHTWMT